MWGFWDFQLNGKGVGGSVGGKSGSGSMGNMSEINKKINWKEQLYYFIT